MEDEVIKFIGQPSRKKPQLFPRDNKKFADGDFAIMNFEVYESLEGNIETNKYGNISVRGYDFPPDYSTTEQYMILAKLDSIDPTYGKQWDLLMCNKSVDLSDVWQQKIFLQAFLTDLQIQNLYSTLKDPMKSIEQHNKDDLMTVNGIGKTTAEKILEKYEDNKDYSLAYVELSSYGLTPNMIKKLCNVYHSADILVRKIKENPYILAGQVKGVGFATVDEMALNAGIPRLSDLRLEAFITHILNEGAQQGFSWISSGVLLDKIEGELDIFPRESVINVVNSMKSREILWDGKVGIIALSKFYELELKIAKEIERINNGKTSVIDDGWIERVEQAEKLNGYAYTEEQKSAIEVVLNNNVSIISGGAGCVDGDTEYFNGREWIKISDYNGKNKVLQYCEDGSGEMVTPLRYIKEKEETLYQMKNFGGSVNQVLSDDHMIAYRTSKGNLKKKIAREFFDSHNKLKNGTKSNFINSFKYRWGSGIPLSDEWVRIMVAVFADGTYNYRAKESSDFYNICVFNIKKDRKKKRLRTLFNAANAEWEELSSVVEGYTKFKIKTPFRSKAFPTDWYNISEAQARLVYDEVVYWDGYTTKKGCRMFSTTVKKDADFIQFVASGLEYTTTIGVCDRRGETYCTGRKEYIRKSIEYTVRISKKKNKLTSLYARKTEQKVPIVEYKDHDGYKYCFTVPSGYLILRRENKIFITGNCGKTTSVLGALNALGDIRFAQCALSGCASARLEEATGFESATIHRTLGVNPKLGEGMFEHNKENPLDRDAVVLDEFSMVGGLLFLSLLEAVPNGAKLIMIGDISQLPAIGALNVANDLIKSPHVEVGWLNQIHRQSAKSGVIVDAHKVKNGEQITVKGFNGKEVRGELKDLEIDIYDNSDLTVGKAIKHFKEKLAIAQDVMDVQLISPVRIRGSASVYNLNTLAQRIYNPPMFDKPELYLSMDRDKGYTFRKGDKVINVKNSYDMPVAFLKDGKYSEEAESGETRTTEVFNGYIGIIVDIVDDNMFVDIPLTGCIVMIPESHWKSEKGVELAYAITVHKVQGQSIPYPICVLDFSHYMMLSRELLYTAMTRSSKHCTLVAEHKALRRAINTTSVQTKQTFLVDLLDEIYDGSN